MENNNNNNPPENENSIVDKIVLNLGELFKTKYNATVKNKDGESSLDSILDRQELQTLSNEIAACKRDIEAEEKSYAEIQAELKKIGEEVYAAQKAKNNDRFKEARNDQLRWTLLGDQALKSLKEYRNKLAENTKRYKELQAKISKSYNYFSTTPKKNRVFSLKDEPKDVLESIVSKIESKNKDLDFKIDELNKVDSQYSFIKDDPLLVGAGLDVTYDAESRKSFITQILKDLGVLVNLDSDDDPSYSKTPITKEQKLQLRREHGELGSIVNTKYKIQEKEWTEAVNDARAGSTFPIIKSKQTAFQEDDGTWYTHDEKKDETFESTTITFPKDVRELRDYKAESIVATIEDGRKFRIPTFGRFGKNDVAYSIGKDGKIRWYYVGKGKNKRESGFGRVAETGFSPYDEETQGGAVFTKTNDTDVVPDDVLNDVVSIVENSEPKPDDVNKDRWRKDDELHEDIYEDNGGGSPDGPEPPDGPDPPDSSNDPPDNPPNGPNRRRPFINKAYLRLRNSGGWTEDFISLMGKVMSWTDVVKDVKPGGLNEKRNKDFIRRRPARLDKFFPRIRDKNGREIPIETALKSREEDPNLVPVDVTGYGGALPDDVSKFNAPWGRYARNDAFGRSWKDELDRYRWEQILETIASRRQGATPEYLTETAKRVYGTSIARQWAVGVLERFGYEDANNPQKNIRELLSLSYRLRDVYEIEPESAIQQISVADASLSGKFGRKAQGALEAIDAATSMLGLNMRLTSFSPKDKQSHGEENPKATWFDIHMPGSKYNAAKKEYGDRVEASQALRDELNDLIEKNQQEEETLRDELKKAKAEYSAAPSDKKKEVGRKRDEIQDKLNKNKAEQEKLAVLSENYDELDELLKQEGASYARGENPTNSYANRWRAGAKKAAETIEDIVDYTGSYADDKVNPEKRPTAETRSRQKDNYSKVVEGIAKTTSGAGGAVGAFGKLVGTILTAVLAFEAIKAAVGWFVKLNKEIENVIREFANYSSLTAVAARWFEAREYQRTLKEAQALETSRADLAKSWSDLKDAAQPLIIAFKDLVNVLLMLTNKILTPLVKIMGAGIDTEPVPKGGFWWKALEGVEKAVSPISLIPGPFKMLHKARNRRRVVEETTPGLIDFRKNPNYSEWMWNYDDPSGATKGRYIDEKDFVEDEDAMERVHGNVMVRGATFNALNKRLKKVSKKEAIEEFEKQAKELGYTPTKLEKENFAYEYGKSSKQEGLKDDAAYYGIATGKEIYMDGAFRDEAYLKQLLSKVDSQHVALLTISTVLEKIDPKLAQIVKDAATTAKNTEKENTDSMTGVIMDFLRNGELGLKGKGVNEWKGDVQKGWMENTDNKDKPAYGRMAKGPSVEWR